MKKGADLHKERLSSSPAQSHGIATSYSPYRLLSDVHGYIYFARH